MPCVLGSCRRPLASLVLVVATSACSSGEQAEPAAGDPAADRRAVQARTIEYLDAYLSGDGERACAQLEPGYRTRQDARARAGGFDGCAWALSELGPELFGRLPADDRAEARRRYLRADRVRVELDGRRATAGFTPGGEGRIVTRLALARGASGDWRITQLGARRRAP